MTPGAISKAAYSRDTSGTGQYLRAKVSILLMLAEDTRTDGGSPGRQHLGMAYGQRADRKKCHPLLVELARFLLSACLVLQDVVQEAAVSVPKRRM